MRLNSSIEAKLKQMEKLITDSQVPSGLDGPRPSDDSVAPPPKSAGYSDCWQRDRGQRSCVTLLQSVRQMQSQNLVAKTMSASVHDEEERGRGGERRTETRFCDEFMDVCFLPGVSLTVIFSGYNIFKQLSTCYPEGDREHHENTVRFIWLQTT